MVRRRLGRGEYVKYPTSEVLFDTIYYLVMTLGFIGPAQPDQLNQDRTMCVNKFDAWSFAMFNQWLCCRFSNPDSF